MSEEREPMIDDRSLDGWCGIWVEHEMSNYEVRDHYESLITNGDLIRKDELVAWLKERVRITDNRLARTEPLTGTHSMWLGENGAWKKLLEHLDTKP